MSRHRLNFTVKFLLLMVAQILICNYFRLTPYICLTIMPAVILCLPTEVSTTWALVIAFATGLAIDLFSEGILGINTLALVPVALVRKSLIDLMFGKELFERKEEISIGKFGYGSVSAAIIIVQALFLIVYIWADGAGTRTMIFNTVRFLLSLLSGYLLSLPVVDIITSDEKR